MLKNKKNVFWQALFVTVLFFFLGLVFGVYLEQIRTDQTNILFYNSETSLYDSFALEKLMEGSFVSCGDFKNASVEFADKIYEEAMVLEKFDDSNKITNSLKIIHKKYDLLRTLLWMNLISAKERCDTEINTVVYLYIYDTEDIQIKSEQIVWSRILGDLKAEKANEIILLPIAVNQDVISLEYLIKDYEIKEFPVVIIDEEHVISEISSVSDLEKYLK